MNIDKPMN